MSPRRLLALYLTGACAAVSAAEAQSRFDNELNNLRALPPGYSAWCEEGDLIFKAANSARFRVAEAALCAGKPNGYVLCTASPTPQSGPAGRPIPACSEITAPGA